MKGKCTPAKATAHAILLMAALLSSGFAHPIELKPSSGRHVQHQHHHAAKNIMRDGAAIRDGTAMREGAIGTAEPTEAPGFPGTLFPQGVAWSTIKAPPKKSLSELPTPQDKTAAAWILNLIEQAHWASFPLGFHVAYFIFENASTLATVLDGSAARVFFIMLGVMCQVFGAGISRSMMVSTALQRVLNIVLVHRTYVRRVSHCLPLLRNKKIQ